MKVKISPQRKNNRGMRHEGERVTFFAKALQAIHKTINDLQIRTPAQANTSKFLLGTTKKTKKNMLSQSRERRTSNGLGGEGSLR